jgi:hypothetical protein
MSYLLEIKVPWEGWQPYKVFHGPIGELLKWLPKWFPKKEIHNIRFKRCHNVAEATEAVCEYWGKP